MSGADRAGRAMSVTGQSRVLVVDDDDTVREVLRRYLTRDGHEVIEAADGITGLSLVRSQQPDLLVLDLMLPGHGRARGLPGDPAHLDHPGDHADRARARSPIGWSASSTAPTTTSSSRSARASWRCGWAGCWNAAAEPVADGQPAATLVTSADGELSADPVSRTARLRGAELALTSREFDLLHFLLQHPGQVFGRAEMMERVWGWSFGDQSTVTVHVRRLREKIEPDPARPTRIVTVWGVGYRLDPGPPPAAATGSAPRVDRRDRLRAHAAVGAAGRGADRRRRDRGAAPAAEPIGRGRTSRRWSPSRSSRC